MEDVTFTASEGDKSCDDDTTLTASTVLGMNESVELPLLEVSIEDDVFNTSIYGHNDEVLADDGTEASDSTDKIPVMTVPPEEAIQMDKCIVVFTDTLMSLLRNYMGESTNDLAVIVSWIIARPMLFPGDAVLVIKEADGQLNPVYQSLYISPAVNEFWEQHKEELWEEKAGKDVVLSGDGRNDSPGHSAQYCTYSLADMEDHAILQMNIMYVREAAGKSNNMERIGFERGMDKLLTSQMSVKEVVTDEKSDKNKDVKHQNDVWHGGKSPAKKKVTSKEDQC
ncbi:Hypothetical predicted protein, partial [Paramuricea clavata]